MTARLARTASGSRHERWGREVLATLQAHIEENPKLTEEQRTRLREELAAAEPLLAHLSTSVIQYRSWLNTGSLIIRAKLRVAGFVLDEEQRIVEGTLRPHRDTLAAVLTGGLSSVFSGYTLSAVVRAGYERAARIGRDGAVALRTVSGVRGLPVLTDVADNLEGMAERIDALVHERDNDIEPQRRPLKLAVERGILELREGFDKMDGRLRQHFSPSFIESLYPELSKSSRAVVDDNDDEDDDDSEGKAD